MILLPGIHPEINAPVAITAAARLFFAVATSTSLYFGFLKIIYASVRTEIEPFGACIATPLVGKPTKAP